MLTVTHVECIFQRHISHMLTQHTRNYMRNLCVYKCEVVGRARVEPTTYIADRYNVKRENSAHASVCYIYIAIA